MVEGPRRTSRHVLSRDLLPPPPFARALAFGGLAAIAGAVVWALLVIFAETEHGVVAWGIGGLVGFAVVRAGGHGTGLAAAAAALAVVAIGTGKHISYQATFEEILDMTLEQVDESSFAERQKDARDWAALADKSNDDAVEEYALDHQFDVDSAEEFRAEFAPDLVEFEREKPDYEQWRGSLRETVAQGMAAEFGFVDYLREDFHPFDVLFVLLGLGTAFGLVSKHTVALQQQARARIRAEREAEEAAEQADEGAAD